nr:transmembrane protein 169-like [Lytechinus pictus]
MKPDCRRSAFNISYQEGPHIVLLSILSLPVVFLCAVCVIGYIGVLTWYNVFLHYFDERTLVHRLTICPLLILTLPLILFSVTLSLSIYASVQQISWHLESWWDSVRDLEKGFFAKICSSLGLTECCPYEVIVRREEDDSFELAAEDVSLKGIVITKSETPSIEL